LIRIKEYNRGGWVIFKNIKSIDLENYFNTTFVINNFQSYYTLVGQENGTIQFKESLYNLSIEGIGFDNTIGFDKTLYDLSNSIELRNIFNAIKKDIFIGDYQVEWNNLFFLGVKMAHAEQMYIDWAFKTSLLTAVHNVGPFIQPSNYNNDNIKYFQDYIDEVKPFRSTVREYVSKYNTIEPTGTGVSDFDLPPAYFPDIGKILPVIPAYNNVVNLDPWSQWYNNNTFSINQINVFDGGNGYTTPPVVSISGDGTGATARAFISNGSVTSVKILSNGSGYKTTPKISLIGGNGVGGKSATAYAQIGSTKARTFNITLKYDRISQNGLFSNFSFSDTFIGTGYTMGFKLSYMPSYNVSSLSITKNGILVLGTDYTVSITKSKSTISMNVAPKLGDQIVITYNLNDSLFDSVNRIQKFYAPTSGMIGNDLSQLMSGIDFGGVQVQSTTFDVSGGWDVLPWDTDTWDSTDNPDYYVMCDGSTTSVTLPFVPLDGQRITLYVQRHGTNTQKLITIPNTNFNSLLPISSTNPDKLVLSFYGDGSTSVLELGQYVHFDGTSFNDGDLLIIRLDNSDGTTAIDDINLLDTNLSGGTFQQINNVYSTASGLLAEDIIVDGGNFISPLQVPATEENIPGQVLDSLSIKVFTGVNKGPSPMYTNVYIGDGSTAIFNIAFPVTSTSSCLVFVNGLLNNNYRIDFETNQVIFAVTPSDNSKIEITSVGAGGSYIIDQKTIIAKSSTKNQFITSAPYSNTSKELTFVTVNGLPVQNTAFTSSDPNKNGKMVVTLANKPTKGDVINIICLSNQLNAELYNIVNQQVIASNAGTINIPINQSQLSNVDVSTCLILINNVALTGPETVILIYNGSNNVVTVGVNPHIPLNSIVEQNISVLLNGIQLQYLIDYEYNTNTHQVTITKELSINDVIKVENIYSSSYTISNNNVILNNISVGDVIDIFWFSGDITSQVVTNDYNGGQSQYNLQTLPIDISYVWVFVSGVKLTANIDFYIAQNTSHVHLYRTTTKSDIVKVITFGSKVHVLAHGYEIHKDMLNKFHYYRYSAGNCFLAQDLNYYDQEIVVTNTTSLSQPYVMKNIPGVIMIGSERIEYFQINGNVLSQLRRGVNGTGINTKYSSSTDVINLSYSEVIPYSENQQKINFTTTGTISTINTPFLPIKSNRSNWVRQTISSNFGPCDTVEVFVGGRRLRKDPISIYNELNPTVPIVLEAEFSVDGISNSIQLTSPITSTGINISVIRRTGRVWYSGSLTDGTTDISKFILKRSTSLPG
jgi:hypothetical protein